ncbi:MAG TPA: hypothetical protein VGI63_05095 [Verrucomicrobiae bacterium]|jgi:hypothetical protein
MKTAIFILAVALICGCNKPTATAPARIQWEYKVVQVENYARQLKDSAFAEMRTNQALGLQHWRDAWNDRGNFYLDSLGAGNDYSVDFSQLGSDGWELVAALPQTETLPGVEYQDGSTFNPNTEKLDPNIQKFNNMRTGKIIFIFKRQR